MTTFAFLDVETTGLDPVENYVLEIAWQLTDGKFNPIAEPQTYLVDLPGIDATEAFNQIHAVPFLINMHQTSGLYHEQNDPFVEKTPMRDILQAFIDDVVEAGAADDHVRLAGYSVSFDREFLKANGWYDLFETRNFPFQMHHRILDLSSVIQMFDAADREVPSTFNENPHRALDDALDALEKAQLMAREIAW